MAAYLRFALLIRKEWYGAIFGIFMSFIATFASVALMGTATWFLSAMAIAGFYDYALNIFIPSALIRLLALARTLLRYGERYYTHDATFRLLAYLRVFLFERALALKLEDAMRLKSSDLQRRLQADLERLEMIYVRQLVPFVCAVLMGMVVGGVLLAFSWALAATALSLMLLAGVLVPVIATRLTEKASREQGTLAVRLNDEMSDLIGGFFDLMLLAKHEARAQNFLQTAKGLAQARAKIIWSEQIAQVFLLTFSELTLLLLLMESVPLVVMGQMSPPQMMMLAVSAMASFEVLQPLSAAALNYPYVAHAAERVSELLHITAKDNDLSQHSSELLRQDDQTRDALSDAELSKEAEAYAAYAARGGVLSKLSSLGQATPSAATPANAGSAAVAATAAGAAATAAGAARECVLELKDVSFAYALEGKQSLPVLSHCSLRFSSQQNYVIKAPSGRGKSTLVLLLTRLLYPQQGELYLNGQAYSSLSGAEIRKHLAVALQDITLFSGTIFETFKQVKPSVTRAEIMQALQLVELDELVTLLPHGLDEWLGSTGLAISGGQARRLCLARALVASSASEQGQRCDFLVLDEPGEGLDEAQEVRIIERLQQERKGVIIITHKQAGLRLADHLIEL